MTQEELTIDLRTENEGKVLVFGLRGSFDIATAKTVRAAMTDAIESADQDVIVDMRELEFIDSTGLGALIGAQKRAAEKHKSLRLVANEGPIERLLNITGLIRVLALYRSIEDALADRARITGSP